MISNRLFIMSALSLALCSCKVGPNYSRPQLTLPDQYRGLAPPTAPQVPAQATPQGSTQTFGEMKWWTVFQDKALEDLIHEALVNNYDIRIAAARIDQA